MKELKRKIISLKKEMQSSSFDIKNLDESRDYHVKVYKKSQTEREFIITRGYLDKLVEKGFKIDVNALLFGTAWNPKKEESLPIDIPLIVLLYQFFRIGKMLKYRDTNKGVKALQAFKKEQKSFLHAKSIRFQEGEWIIFPQSETARKKELIKKSFTKKLKEMG